MSETATEPPQEEGQNLNSPKCLALEATFVNHNFSQQVLKVVSNFDDVTLFLISTMEILLQAQFVLENGNAELVVDKYRPLVNRNVNVSVKGDDRYDMDQPNPFAQEEESGDIASVAYRLAQLNYDYYFLSTKQILFGL